MDNSPKKARFTENTPREGLAKRLFDLRMDTEHNGQNPLTQDTVAEKLSLLLYGDGNLISSKRVSSWENDDKEPKLDVLVGLAKVFNTTCDYLLTGVEPERVDTSRRYGLSNDALQKLEEMNSRMRLADFVETEPFYYLKPVEFINMLITSENFDLVAIKAMNYVLMKSLFDEKAESIDLEMRDSAKFTTDYYKNWANIVAIMYNNPTFANYKIVKRRDYLDSIEYTLSILWTGIFRRFIDNESIIKNGIVQSDTLNREWLGLKTKE